MVMGSLQTEFLSLLAIGLGYALFVFLKRVNAVRRTGKEKLLCANWLYLLTNTCLIFSHLKMVKRFNVYGSCCPS